MPSVDPMLASVGASMARARSASCSAAWAATASRAPPAGRSRRLGARPGQAQLRGLGHAARGARSRPRLRRAAAGQDRPPDRVADRGALRADKRQFQPNPCRPARGADRAATDHEPPLADRDRSGSLLRERGIATLDELITILVMGREPSLSQRVVEALLNNETYFFRDRSPFDLLSRHALPELARRRAKAKRLRIWSAGCSTGQEVYSLAMLFAEEPDAWRGWTDRHSRHRRFDGCDRARARRRLHPVRGSARPRHRQMIKLVRGVRRRLARSSRCASRSASRSTICSSRRRIRAGSTSCCAATSCSISAPTSARSPSSGCRGDGPGRLADARRRRDGDRPDRTARLRHQCRGLYRADRRRRSAIEKRARPRSQESHPGLDRTAKAGAP